MALAESGSAANSVMLLRRVKQHALPEEAEAGPPGQRADAAPHEATITAALPVSSTRLTRSPARCGNNTNSRASP